LFSREVGRYAHFALGDTLAVISTRGPKTVPEVPADQVLTCRLSYCADKAVAHPR
jgi:hypothetical protein